MRYKHLRILAWLLVVVFGLAVVTDAICELGLNRGWQYLYNAFYFVCALPALLALALKDEKEYE